MDSWNRNQNAKPFQNNKSNSWRSEWSQEKQYDKRERTGTHSHSSQNDRFNKDRVANNRYDRDKSYNKYDEDDVNISNRGNRGIPRDSGNRFTGSERRYNRNNSSDKTNSDKDSDTSSKDNDRRGKGDFKRNNFNDSRGEYRGGASSRLQTTNWSDKKPAYKTNYRNEKSNGT